MDTIGSYDYAASRPLHTRIRSNPRHVQLHPRPATVQHTNVQRWHRVIDPASDADQRILAVGVSDRQRFAWLITLECFVYGAQVLLRPRSLGVPDLCTAFARPHIARHNSVHPFECHPPPAILHVAAKPGHTFVVNYIQVGGRQRNGRVEMIEPNGELCADESDVVGWWAAGVLRVYDETVDGVLLSVKTSPYW